MDFRVSQKKGTTFIYVLPFSSTRAFVEYTLFSPALLEKEEYDKGLKNYITEHINITDYTIEKEEFGIIPMTNHRFKKSTGNIINLGTAGGQTKASSGYTFQFIQKQTAMIVDALCEGRSIKDITVSAKRFHFYDSVLLNILYNNTLPCDEIFTGLFKKNPPKKILKFLDNETAFAEEPAILLSLPFWPFLKAAIKVI
jgi:lycopene beta-cyclase